MLNVESDCRHLCKGKRRLTKKHPLSADSDVRIAKSIIRVFITMGHEVILDIHGEKVQNRWRHHQQHILEDKETAGDPTTTPAFWADCETSIADKTPNGENSE